MPLTARLRTAIALIALVIVIMPAALHATTINYSGNIYSSLSPTQDTVVFTANTTIMQGATITIGAGKVVRIASGATINVQGAIRALGTESDSVYFEPQTTTAWRGLKLDNSSGLMGQDSTLLVYASIRGADRTALTVHSYDLVRVSHCTFYDCENTNTSSALTDFRGGALGAINSSFLIEHTLFEGNKSIQNYIYQGAGTFIRGGAMRINNCRYENNLAKVGGGIYVDNGESLLIENSTFSDNRIQTGSITVNVGGALYSNATRITVRDCSFESSINANYSGAAIYAAGGILTLERDTVSGFLCTNGPGAPLRLSGDSIFITNCVLNDNSTSYANVQSARGGALNVTGNVIRLVNVLACNNRSYHYSGTVMGGAIYAVATEKAEFVNCTVINNHAEDESFSVTSQGGGIFTDSKGSLYNCILWGNSADLGSQVHGTSTPNQYFCVVQGNQQTPHPIFADSASGDFRLTAQSPYIDAGYILAPGIPALDLDGNPRSVHHGVDVGAYEFQGERPEGLMGFFNKDTLLGPGEYEVKSPRLMVLDGKVLRVASGAILRFPSGTSLDVYGSLRTEGSESEPVVLTASQTSWLGINFYSRSRSDLPRADSSIVRGCILEKAAGSAATVNSYTRVLFQNTVLRDMNQTNGIYVAGQGSVVVDSCLFKGLNWVGVTSTSNIYLSNDARLEGRGSVLDSTIGGIQSSGDMHIDGWKIGKGSIFSGAGNLTIRNSILDSAYINASGTRVSIINSIVARVQGTTPAVSSTSGDLFIINSAILNNAYYGVNARVTAADSLFVRNSILWNNYGGDGVPQMQITGSAAPFVSFSCVHNGWSGTENLSVDPQISGDAPGSYQIAFASPCVNAGDTTGILSLLPSKDLLGEHRIRNGRIDIGPWEYQTGAIWDDFPTSIGMKQTGAVAFSRSIKLIPGAQASLYFDGWGKGASFTVADMRGRIVLSGSIVSGSIKARIPAGMYVVSARDGSAKMCKRILMK